MFEVSTQKFWGLDLDLEMLNFEFLRELFQNRSGFLSQKSHHFTWGSNHVRGPKEFANI